MNWMPVSAKISWRGTTANVFFEHSVGARVAIVARVIHQRAVRTQESKVDAPGVNSDAVQRQLPLPAADGKRLPDFVEQPECIPIKAREQTYGRVWKAVQFFECEPAVLKRAKYRAPSFGPQIDSQKPAHGS